MMEERELKAALGKNIKFFRFRGQLSQADLADRAGISITFLSNIERGNNFPQAGTLCNLAKALNVQVWELFRGARGSDQEDSMVDSITDDFVRQLNLAIEAVYRQYKA